MALEYRMKQGKANRVLPKECTGHSKHPLPKPQEKILHMDITRWSIPSRRPIQSAHELLIAKFRLKLKKVGKTLDHSGMT